jgi:16S rRNA (cytosine1402-N4)-methyltransferase
MHNSPKRMVHQSVLYYEVIEGLAIRPGGAYLDATVGGGGHAAALLEQSAPDGRLLALDADPDALPIAAERLSQFGDRVTLVNANYADLGRVAQENGFASFDGALFDLGLSSTQLSVEGRGFSFQDDQALDMRLSPTQEQTAADIVNSLPEPDLADLIYTLGDERASRRIARAIVQARPLQTTSQLAAVIERSIGRHGKLHPATKTFMALRRSVNDETAGLQAALPQAVQLLVAGGRLAVIAFHSGEDRIVKEYLRKESRDCICPPGVPVCVCGHKASVRLINRHVIVAGDDERRQNPRSRSARLRVAEKL